MSVDWRSLFANGELQRIAAECRTRAEFAARFGLSEEGARKQMMRRGIPSFGAMKFGDPMRRQTVKCAASSTSDVDVDVSDLFDFSDEEPTQPNREGEVRDSRIQDSRSGQFEAGSAESSRAGTDVIPSGHFESGRSTLKRGAPGSDTVLVWHKTSVSKEQHFEAIRQALEDLPKPWRGQSEPVEQTELPAERLMNVVMMGDPHLGLMTWRKETGTDHDLATGERDLVNAVHHLVDQLPAAELGVVCSLGDLVHIDNESNTTTRGTKQDADSRWFKVMQTTLRAKRCAIDDMKRKHNRVLGRIIRGNHDWHSSAMIAMGLAQYYENDPRVEIEVSPDPFSWLEFGKNLLGFTHTDECRKPEDLAAVMAIDQAEAWGRTIYRYMMGGHEHHAFAKETRGVLFERFPTLAPKCSWAHRKGYRALQSMCADTYHYDWGRIARRTVGIRQLRAA